MATAIVLFDNYLLSQGNKEIDLENDVLKVMLTTSTYTPDAATHAYKDNVTNEVVGTGYTAGGATITNNVYTLTGASDWATLNGDDVTWATSTITARYAVIYDSTPATDATRPLIGYMDFSTDQITSGTDFVIQWNASGILRHTIV